MFEDVFASEVYLQILPLIIRILYLLEHQTIDIQRGRVMNYLFLVTVQILPLSLMVYPKVPVTWTRSLHHFCSIVLMRLFQRLPTL